MTTLIYKLNLKALRKTKHALRLCAFYPEEGDKFSIELPEDGKVIIGSSEQDSVKRAAIFQKRAFSDGSYPVKVIISGKLYTAEPLLIDGGEIYPVSAGAGAVVELSRSILAMEEKLSALTDEVNSLHEKIGSKQIFKIT